MPNKGSPAIESVQSVQNLTADDGKTINTNSTRLDAIIAVGYWVNLVLQNNPYQSDFDKLMAPREDV